MFSKRHHANKNHQRKCILLGMSVITGQGTNMLIVHNLRCICKDEGKRTEAWDYDDYMRRVLMMMMMMVTTNLEKVTTYICCKKIMLWFLLPAALSPKKLNSPGFVSHTFQGIYVPVPKT